MRGVGHTISLLRRSLQPGARAAELALVAVRPLFAADLDPALPFAVPKAAAGLHDAIIR